MSKTIVCPRCGRYLKFHTDLCKYCGFSFVRAFEEFDNKEGQLNDVINEYEQAINTGDKLKAYLCLGKLEMLNDPKFHLRCGIVLMNDGEFLHAEEEFFLYEHDLSAEDIIRSDEDDSSSADDSHEIVDTITIDTSLTEKEKEILPYRLENYALSGQLFQFDLIFAGSRHEEMELFQQLYLSQLALDNASDWDLQNYIDIHEELSKAGEVRVVESYRDNNSKYKSLFERHLCNDIVNMVLYWREAVAVNNVYADADPNNLPEFSSDDVSIYFKRLIKYLVLIPVEGSDGNNLLEYIIHPNLGSINTKEYDEWLEELLGAILLTDDKQIINEPANLFEYFICLEELKMMELYCKKVDHYYNELAKLADQYPNNVKHIIGTAYYERKTCGINIKASMEEFIQANLQSVAYEKENEENRRIYSFLTQKGKIAMEVADWEYENSERELYGWRDAGPLSLSFFRIIELELNQRFVLPLIERCGATNIENTFNVYLNAFTGNVKNAIYKNWNDNIRFLKQISNPSNRRESLELGSLKILINSISEVTSGNAFYDLLYGNLFDGSSECILTQKGLRALEEHELESVISDEKRSKYRNPPAHTKYLPYSVAKECRKHVRDTILQFGEWFNM